MVKCHVRTFRQDLSVTRDKNYCTISIDSSPRDFFYLSEKSPKTAKIEKILLPLSAKIGCDA